MGVGTFRSARNVVLGSCFILGAVILVVVQVLPHIAVVARVIELGVAVECTLIGIRLIFTSSLQVTTNSLTMRNRWGQRIVIPYSDIDTVEMGSRNFAYDRSFPRIRLKSGKVVDLLAFEQASSRATKKNSSVRQLIDKLSPHSAV
jgi:hypothetical protein